METRADIVQRFANTAEHPEQCYDFDIQCNLDKFMKCTRQQINFSEAAFLVFHAAQVYGRKVDYLQQVFLDFNERSAATIAKAIAEKQKELQESEEKEKDEATKKNDKKKEEAERRNEREKEKALKRAKRMQKTTGKIEFKPKPFTIGTPLQISLNIHEKRSELECEEEFDQLRMKNVFPRINVLQSNLQNNNTFYDNLGIVEKHCDNLDSLRDYRIFMDTIDEPIYSRPTNGNQTDAAYEDDYNRSQRRANQKHSNIYLSADYIKENYGVTIKDNSDYLNMLKYSKEVERLNLRKLTIEQLSKLKVGSYLNNILHGNKQDDKIPEHDSGIDDMDMCMDGDASPPEEQSDSFNLDTTLDATDDLNITTELDTTNELNSPSEPNTTNELNTSGDLNTTGISSADTSLNLSEPPLNSSNENETTAEQSLETTQNTECTENSALLNVTQPGENKSIEPDRQSDDGFGGSVCQSPSQLDNLSIFEGFDGTGGEGNVVSELLAINGSVEVLNAISVKVPVLDSNIFQLPEKLLRRTRIFHLTEEFDTWMSARKRKFNAKPDPPSCGKLLKLSTGVMIRADPDSDDEEFLGFDEENHFKTTSATVVEEEANVPATIANRTNSSDSGMSNEGVTMETDDVNSTQIAQNDSQTLNDSQIDTTLTIEPMLESTLNNGPVLESTGNTTVIDETLQQSDISGMNIDANSTQICDAKSMVTAMDSGFGEGDSQLLNDTTETVANFTELDDVLDLPATTSSEPEQNQLTLGKRKISFVLIPAFLLNFFFLNLNFRHHRAPHRQR